MRTVKESDWKMLRRLQPVALDRFCKRVLAEAQQICSAPEVSAHDRYLKLYRFMRDQDRDLARTFDDVRRSNALERAAWMRSLDLITNEEFAGFSEDLQATVSFWLGEE